MKKISFSLFLLAATFGAYAQKPVSGNGIKLTESGGQIEISSKSPVFKNLLEMRTLPAHLLDTGTIYFRNTARVFVPYKWNPTSTSPDDSASVIQRTGTATGRFELYYEDYIMVDWFGAIPNDERDDSYSVQKAVDFAINSVKSPQVRFGGGSYNVSNVKLARKNGNQFAFSTVEVKGTGFSPGTKIVVKADGVGFFVQNGRQTIIDNIHFEGKLFLDNAGRRIFPTPEAIFTQSDAAWVEGVRNNKFSPHAAIADGAFASTVPPGDQYPGESAWYTDNSRSGTSGLRITNCYFTYFNVAVIQGSSARNANGDNVNIEGCTFDYNRIVYAPCQTQSRANSIVNCYMMHQQYVVNAYEFGNRQGTPPNLEQCNIAGATKYLYYINTGFGGMTINRCRMESIFSLGKSSGIAVNFTDNEITPTIPGEGGRFGATKFAEGGHVSFKGGELKWFDNCYVGGFVFDVQNLSFDGVSLGGLPVNFWSGPISNFFLNRTVYNNCKFFSATTNGDVWQAGTWQGIEFSNFLERSIVMPGTKYVENNASGQMFNSYESLSPKIELISVESKTLRLDSASATAWFRTSSPGSYQEYDVLSDPFEKRTMPGSIYSPGPSVLGWVYKVSGDTVKIKYVPHGLNERTQYSIHITRIPHFAPKLIGNVTAGSNKITNARHYGTVYPRGILIKGPGLPSGTRVIAVDGKTITISNNATTNATDVEFFDANMHCTAVGNPSEATSIFGYYKGDVMRNTDPSVNKISHWVCTKGGWMTSGSAQAPIWEPVYIGSSLNDGSYTASLTNGTNVAGTTFRSAQYQRVGNTVTLFVVFDINATKAGAFNVDISLPVASNFTSAFEAGGTASNGSGAGSVSANATNDRLKLSGTASAAGSSQWTAHVTYKVIAP